MNDINSKRFDIWASAILHTTLCCQRARIDSFKGKTERLNCCPSRWEKDTIAAKPILSGKFSKEGCNFSVPVYNDHWSYKLAGRQGAGTPHDIHASKPITQHGIPFNVEANMIEKIITPYAPILVESTRSIGYSFEAAVADIIDNSISASATDIQIHFFSQEPQYLCIQDNGCGMSAEELESAMRYGSRNPRDVRTKNDLGRFGLGMKMASLSQCRKVTVMSKREGNIAAACWDMDYIIQTGEWSLKTYVEEELERLPGYEFLRSCENGTAVLWQNFDRLQQTSSNVSQSFDERIEQTREHVSLVFHRFLNDENSKQRITISFNNDPVEGLDPFLTKHPATQPMGEQTLRINGEEIIVKPYVLPFASKLKRKDIVSIGGTDDLRQHQGFYVYRNRRLIIWGTWFRLIARNELGKLARVRVDIPNSLDSIWEIDIKKSTASLPPFIKKNLADIVRTTVGVSERIYRHRGRNIQTDNLIHVWNPIDNRGHFQYRINRELPLYEMLENHMDDEGAGLLNSFIEMIEDTFPYADAYYRMAKRNGQQPDGESEETACDIATRIIGEIEASGGDVSQSLRILEQTDFFVKYPGALQKIREAYTNDEQSEESHRTGADAI